MYVGCCLLKQLLIGFNVIMDIWYSGLLTTERDLAATNVLICCLDLVYHIQ